MCPNRLMQEVSNTALVIMIIKLNRSIYDVQISVPGSNQYKLPKEAEFYDCNRSAEPQQVL